MNKEQIKKELGPRAVFDIGEENSAFAQFFVGQSYLSMLTTEGHGILIILSSTGKTTRRRQTVWTHLKKNHAAARKDTAPALIRRCKKGEKT